MCLRTTFVHIMIYSRLFAEHYYSENPLLHRLWDAVLLCPARSSILLLDGIDLPQLTRTCETGESKSLFVENPITGEIFPREGECRRLPPATEFNTK